MTAHPKSHDDRCNPAASVDLDRIAEVDEFEARREDELQPPETRDRWVGDHPDDVIPGKENCHDRCDFAEGSYRSDRQANRR